MALFLLPGQARAGLLSFNYDVTLTVNAAAATPEPGALTLALVGIGGLFATRLRRRYQGQAKIAN